MILRNITLRFFVTVLASLMLLGTARTVAADTITLMWDANPEPQVTGYIVHVGTQPGSYTQHVDVGLSTAHAFTTATAGQQYCFAVSAYFAGPVVGPNSVEVCGFSNAPPTLTAPGNQQSLLSQPTSLQLRGSDPLGEPVTYAATGLPPGLSVMASTGYISGTPTTAGSYSVTATVSDGVLSASRTFTWTISGTDTAAPVVTIAAPTSSGTYSTTTQTLSLSGTASDGVGVTQVSWANNRGGSGAASGTTSWSVAGVTLQSGANVLTISARDAAGNVGTTSLTVNYNLPATAPTLAAVANQTSTVGKAVSLQLVASDANNDTLTYGAQSLPPGLSISSTSGLISGTPTTVGTYSVLVGVMDTTSLYATRNLTWTVSAAADTTAPVVTITAPAVASIFTATSATIALGGTATDSVGVTQVTWANNRGGNGTASGTTTWSVPSVALQGGSNVITVTARDAAGNTSNDVLTVTFNVNNAPTLAAVANQTAKVGQAVTLQLSGSDPDGGALTYGATGLPAGLSLVPSTGRISGTPTTAGTYAVTVTVSDGTLSASQSFPWTVTALDTTAPVVAITAPTSAAAWTSTTAAVNVSGSASDSVGVTQVTWTNNRGGSGTASGTTSWSAGAVTLQVGVNTITVTARDAAGNAASAVLSVTYNVAPTLAAVANQSSSVGQAASLRFTGADANNDVLTYSATGLPAGLSVASSTGVVSGTTTTAGSYPVTATVSDGSLTASRSFTWVVAGDTTKPTVTITGPTSGTTFTTTSGSVTVSGTASDAFGVTQVTWSNNRGGAGTAAGTTAWSASVALQSGTNIVTVTARDAAGNTATDVLTITRNSIPPTAPTVAAVPNQSTRILQGVSLQVVASDVNGDSLFYGALNLPPGLTISSSTGLITGRPTATGTYSVTVGASDGTLYSVRTFTWTVRR